MTTRSRITLLMIVLLAAMVPTAGGEVESRPAAAEIPAETAPAGFAVRFETTKGAFVIEAYRPWAPHAADRFYNLARSGYLDGNLFYRVSADNGVDFGVNGDPRTTKAWGRSPIPCDPPRRKVRTGDVVLLNNGFCEGAGTEVRIQMGPDGGVVSRTGAAPLGRVVEGAEVLASLDSSHMRDDHKWAKMMRTLFNDGDANVRKDFPKIDSILRATLVERTVELPAEDSPGAVAGTPLAPGSALVRVYRTDASVQKFTLRVDGTARAVLEKGTVFEAALPAGRHEFTSKVKFKMFATGIGDKLFASRDRFDADLEPGGVYHVRAAPAGDGRTLQLYLVANDFGAEECRKLAPAKPLEAAEEDSGG